jgi:hypothetical protein
MLQTKLEPTIPEFERGKNVYNFREATLIGITNINSFWAHMLHT